MPGKRLTTANGDIVEDRVCDECDTACLPPAYEFCPYCGDEL